MRYFIFILLLFFATISFCQNEEIYKLTFSDTSNFKITTYLGHKRPTKFFIIDTTGAWPKERFWLNELISKSAQVIMGMESDEHHPYNHTYLFKDTTLNMLISDNEKKLLSQKTETLKSGKIVLNGKNYQTVSNSKNIKGFYFVTSEPVLSSDKKHAFINIVVFHKDYSKQDLDETYFGTICIIYEKQQDNNWKKIRVKNHLIL